MLSTVVRRGVKSLSKVNVWRSENVRQLLRFAAARGVHTSRVGAASGEDGELHSFQAETKQLLDIVTHALYTDKDVFLRELISNSSDALEKLRHLQVTGAQVADSKTPLEIRITTDEKKNQVIIEDTGIGMTKEDLVENLGTIAHSGSKAFLQQLAEQGASMGEDVKSNLIGQFGVGFYSAFMVGDRIEVQTSSASPSEQAHRWISNGDGSYRIAPIDGKTRGTKIIIHLKPSCEQFATARVVKDIIQRYSKFINFPIFLNGEKINTVKALWTMNKSEVTDEMYNEFYRYISKQFDTPSYHIHFHSDAPIDLKALLFMGQRHEEKWGMGTQKPGVALYSRRVLIEPESAILPDWLRFMYGVVDSEDIPLNISRESMQDSALIVRIRKALTRRILRFLDQESKKDVEKFNNFILEFGHFFKQGVCMDQDFQKDIAKLLRFESSTLKPGELTSLDEYISRCPPEQTKIYYLVAPHRGLAESSPYMEAFRALREKTGEEPEVLFCYQPVDDFVMNNIREYGSREIVAAESGAVDVNLDQEDRKTEESKPPMSETELTSLETWLKDEALSGRISKVKASTRLTSSPAVVTDHESASMRKMMRMLDIDSRDAAAPKAEDSMMPKVVLEINTTHPIIKSIHQLRTEDEDLARAMAEQVFDNALIAAGLLDDSRIMLPRLNRLLTRLCSLTEQGSPALPLSDSGYPQPERKDTEWEAETRLQQAMDTAFANELENHSKEELEEIANEAAKTLKETEGQKRE